MQGATNQPAAVDRKTDMPEQNKHRLTILQWNCDCLTTKVVELSELTVRYGIDIIDLQETKLGRDDTIPVPNGFDTVRRYRPGSGTRSARGGGLLSYIKKGIPCSEVPAAQQFPLKKLHVTIPTTRRQHITIANVYFPPTSSNYVQPMEDRKLRSGVHRLLGSPRQELEQSFAPKELATVMKPVKAGKAGGPDGVAPDLLKHLPLNTQTELLLSLNASWTTGWCPQAWRTATIVSFLKKKKDPQAVSSHRPIALTSTIGKLLERHIVNRLSWWLEAKSLLSPVASRVPQAPMYHRPMPQIVPVR